MCLMGYRSLGREVGCCHSLSKHLHFPRFILDKIEYISDKMASHDALHTNPNQPNFPDFDSVCLDVHIVHIMQTNARNIT